MEIDNGELVAKQVGDFVNVMGHSDEGFVRGITTLHRTLQQSVFGIIIKLIYKWAEMHDSGRFDLRNEDTVVLCKKITEALGEQKGVAHI